ncbi:sialidase family protein [Hyalangium rubrum]|uniref:Sialidase family protein n=1 Tax=Hyalangium rubrum TaxID=3103134 RepID=A0ABU5H136_9BACT|nr:sialidase family protein [Hyalangium sp. s54d21]MDY7227164.1 sialidase family protein [Hyalangium sp. s54d21]
MLLGCLLFTTSLFAAQPLAPIGDSQALTSPAQRHVVRLAPPEGSAVWLVALQQQGQQGRGLGLFRSDDEGQTWSYLGPLQNDPTHRDTADLLAVGSDVALVYSYEGSTFSGSSRHDVSFQWWRYQASTRTWTPSAAVRVFDSPNSSTGYSRAELTRDSQGRLWVQAFRLEADGSNTAVLAVSTDGGRTFQPQQPLVTLPRRGGGRILHLGDRLLFLYGQQGTGPAWFRVRKDSAPLDSWEPQQQAFPEGIYQGFSLSAVSPGGGRMHLVYKSSGERLFYRAFNGTAFDPPITLESSGDWALQPAVTLVGDELVVFANPPITLNTHHTLSARVLTGGSVNPPQVLERSIRFRGYLAAPERLPASVTRVPCFSAETADPNSAGMASVTFFERGEARPRLEVVHTNTTHRFLTLAPSGAAYALQLNDSSNRLYMSTDGARTWSFKGQLPQGGSFRFMAALSDGTLLAHSSRDGRNYIARSGDGGATWSEVLLLGDYRVLTPRSFAELDGTVYVLEYQTFTTQDVPIRLHASTDRGRTWQVRQTFSGHRHGHGLAVDPARHALWAFFGDTTVQSGTFRSTDGGRTWKSIAKGAPGRIVDATVLEDGSLLYAQDTLYLPPRPYIAQLSPDGTYVELGLLPGPSYSAFAASAGGFVVGSAREPGGDVYPPGEESAHVFASVNMFDWEKLLSYRRLDPTVTARADVYYELPSGLLILQLQNVQGFGPGGFGYQLLRLTRR